MGFQKVPESRVCHVSSREVRRGGRWDSKRCQRAGGLSMCERTGRRRRSPARARDVPRMRPRGWQAGRRRAASPGPREHARPHPLPHRLRPSGPLRQSGGARGEGGSRSPSPPLAARVVGSRGGQGGRGRGCRAASWSELACRGRVTYHRSPTPALHGAAHLLRRLLQSGRRAGRWRAATGRGRQRVVRRCPHRLAPC